MASDPQLRANMRAALGDAINADVLLCSTVRFAAPPPAQGFFTMGRTFAQPHVVEGIDGETNAKWRYRLPREFTVAITDAHMVAASLRFGAGVGVRKLLATWSLADVRAEPSPEWPAWVVIRIGGAKLTLEPTDPADVRRLLEALTATS